MLGRALPKAPNFRKRTKHSVTLAFIAQNEESTIHINSKSSVFILLLSFCG